MHLKPKKTYCYLNRFPEKITLIYSQLKNYTRHLPDHRNYARIPFAAGIVLFFLINYFSCVSTRGNIPEIKSEGDKISPDIVKDTPIQIEIPRTEMEIAMMIQDLVGKPLDKWTSDLPTYYGLDTRNNQNMNVIKFCGKQKCEMADYILFLVYIGVNMKQCMDISAQPLVNPRDNKFIGCEPVVKNLEKTGDINP